MSGKIFKDKMGNKGLKKGGTYKRASLTYDPELIQKLLRHYYTDAPSSYHYWSLSDEFADIIKTHAQEDIDPRQFLDAVVAKASTARGLSSSSYLDDFLTPLVQALYNLEYNSFELDFSLCETDGRILYLATGLRGKPGNLLEVRYKGISPYRVGNSNEFCKLSLDGAAESVGPESEWSEFTVTKRVPLSGLADVGSNCVFRIGEPDPGDLMFCEYLDHITEAEYGDALPHGPVLVYLKNKGFFERNNKLYFPDGPGKWKEVLPE